MRNTEMFRSQGDIDMAAVQGRCHPLGSLELLTVQIWNLYFGSCQGIVGNLQSSSDKDSLTRLNQC
jgi:hypothetical protein